MSANRKKLPTNRMGTTTKFTLYEEDGKTEVELYITVNVDKNGKPMELFGRASEGHQPHLEDICIPCSMALQYGVPPDVLASKLRFRSYPPRGWLGPSQPKSIADAVGMCIEAAIAEEKA